MRLAALLELKGACRAGEAQPGAARGVPVTGLELPQMRGVWNDQRGPAGVAEAVKHLTWGFHSGGGPGGGRQPLGLRGDGRGLPHGHDRMSAGAGQQREAQPALAMEHLHMGIQNGGWSAQLRALLRARGHSLKVRRGAGRVLARGRVHGKTLPVRGSMLPRGDWSVNIGGGVSRKIRTGSRSGSLRSRSGVPREGLL